MNGYLILQWPEGERKILDYIPGHTAVSYEILQRYTQLFNVPIDWIQADQKEWLREHGFIT